MGNPRDLEMKVDRSHWFLPFRAFCFHPLLGTDRTRLRSLLLNAMHHHFLRGHCCHHASHHLIEMYVQMSSRLNLCSRLINQSIKISAKVTVEKDEFRLLREQFFRFIFHFFSRFFEFFFFSPVTSLNDVASF
jgi:hypothetical protein